MADDLTDRLAAALTDAAGLGDARQVPHEDRVIRWWKLLAEHADRTKRPRTNEAHPEPTAEGA